MLEPAGAVAVAGLKKYVDAMPQKYADTKGNFVVISSDASNIEFDVLRCARVASPAAAARAPSPPPSPHLPGGVTPGGVTPRGEPPRSM